MRDGITSKTLEKLKEQQKSLNARIASEQARIRNKQRKIDTRKKILVGAYFLQEYEKKMDELVKMIDPFLTRKNDRALFGLDPKNDDK
jgi:hypothetical protein